MVNIVFILADGTQLDLSAPTGSNVMTAATRAGVSGIVAECGGGLMCATCHVYVDDASLDKLPPPEADELGMLDCTTAERLPNSRLSCQIHVTDKLDGLIIRVPSQQ